MILKLEMSIKFYFGKFVKLLFSCACTFHTNPSLSSSTYMIVTSHEDYDIYPPLASFSDNLAVVANAIQIWISNLHFGKNFLWNY